MLVIITKFRIELRVCDEIIAVKERLQTSKRRVFWILYGSVCVRERKREPDLGC
jgi:hypothetical protein